MADNIIALKKHAVRERLQRQYPESLSLGRLIELLTRTDLKANPDLLTVRSVVMEIDDILANEGEIFIITNDNAKVDP